MAGCLGNAFDDNIWLIILIAVIILCCFAVKNIVPQEKFLSVT